MRLLLVIQLFLSCLFATQLELTKEEKSFLQTHPSIKVGIESAKPYIYFNKEKNDIDGLYADIFKIVLQKTNLKVEYVKDDWSNLLANFKNKKLDLLPATFYSKKREEFGFFSDSFYNVREYIYVKSTDFTSYTDLNYKKVAVVKGYATIEKLKKKFPSIIIIETKDLHESVELVRNDKVDALVDYHLVVENFLYENTIVGLKGFSQNFLDAVSVHYLSHIDKPILHSILQKALRSITKEEKNKVLRNWFSNVYINSSNQLLTIKEKEFIDTHKTIRFRVRPNRAPFEFEENGEAKGIAVEYVKRSAQNVGLNVEFVVDDASMKDAYKIINGSKDRFDTLLYNVKNKQRAKLFSYGDAFLSYPMMIISHKNAPYISSMRDLDGKTIVLEKAFLTNKWIKRDFPNIKIVNAPNTKAALEMVNSEKAVAYVGNLGIANYMINFKKMDNLKVAAPSPYGEVKYRFFATKDWPELTSLLSKGYAKISPSEHSAIQQQWFSIRTVDTTNYELLGRIFIGLVIIILVILWWNRKVIIEKNKTKKALDELQKVKDNLEKKNKEVQESQQFLQLVIDESPNPIVVKNYDGKFILVNQCVADLYQTDKDSMIGKDDGDFIDDEEMAEFFRQNVRDVMDKGKTQIVYEDSQDVNTGETRNFMSIKKPFKNLENENCILVIANDITDIKKLEEEKVKNREIFFKQSKMAAMGEMIGNIAHQWRQPLSVIASASTGVLLYKDMNALTDELIEKEMNHINDNAQYLSKTIDDFRDFIKGERKLIDFHLEREINSFLNLVHGNIKTYDIHVEKNNDETIELRGYPNELIQCFINIFNNAKDVLENIEGERYFFITTQNQDDSITITFKDNAGGIPSDILPKIFEPYFTTKHKSQGTGLGLHMTYNLITDGMKGTIEVQNETYTYNNKKYTGAKFTITLPRYQ